MPRKNLKLGLIGYGKMGRLIEAIALKRGHEISAISSSSKGPLKECLNKADILIDFSEPGSVLQHAEACAIAKKPLVIGTTGWDHLDAVKALADKHQTAILFSPNFSIGMLLFKKLVKEAARLFSPYEQYDIGGFEIHHNLKADAPSGTAIALTDAILSEWPRKKEAQFSLPEDKISPEMLHFTSLRVGSNPGTHEVVIDSPEDCITLTHAAKSREGFALGAVVAAEWIDGKKGYFTMEDLLK
ncbi:MAG: 4-hydroxy-tetrahydrodipicolinate reductase [Parachlamydiaceae bacterium]